jgi:hypothetical protein
MAVTKKPKTKATLKNVDVEALIRKGGSVAAEVETADSKAKVYAVVLRLPADLAQRIDQAVQARRIKMPRHTWLLEAAMEKLERESN